MCSHRLGRGSDGKGAGLGARLQRYAQRMGQTFTHRIRVRYAECDAQGVVFNAHYYAYFDILMTELWRAILGSYDAMLEGGADMSVVASGARFIAPARFDDEIEVDVRIARIGTSSVTYEFAAYLEGETLAVTATQTLVLVDLATRKPTPVPDRWREQIRAFEGDDLDA